MKKALALLLSACCLLAFAVPAFAATPDNILTYELSSDGSHEVTVASGDIVTVTYTITASARSATSTTQDQIIYDHTFFELVEGSISKEEAYTDAFTTSNPIETDGTHYIYYNSTANVTFKATTPTVIGTFKLKVLATSGSSTITNTAYFATDKNADLFGSAKQDLTVIIGGSAPHEHAGVKQDGVPAGEYTPGYKDYYKCSCNKLFEEEACETEITDIVSWKAAGGRGYLAPTHKHAGVKQDGTPAGEFNPGFKDYYKCSCGGYFEDEACTTPISDLDEWKSEGGRGYLAPTHVHGNGVKQDGKPATEDVAGYKDYYECSCGGYFEDATCTVAIDNLEAWKSEGGRGYIAPLGHTHVGVLQSGVPAQEFEAGYKDYYACKCGNLYEDAACTVAIPNFDAWKSEGGRGYLAPTHVHGNGVKQDGKPATEEAAGYKDYYKCSCGDLFEDEACTTPIDNFDAWKSEGGRGYLPKLPHTHKNGVKQDGVPAEEFKAGCKDYYECSCGGYFEDAACTVAIPDLDEWKSEGGRGYLAPTHVHGNGVKRDGVPAEEFKAGYKDYYECSCGGYFEDATCTVVIPDLDEWKSEGGRGYLAPTHVHGNGVKRDGVPAEEFKAGYKDYYECSCGGYFEDAACTVAIPELEAWKSEGGRGYLPMLHEHELEKHDGVPATKEAAGYKDYYECKNEECAKYFEDATAKVEISDLDAWKSEGGRGYIAKLPKEEEKKDQPDTGDNGNLALWFVLMSLAGAVVCGTSFYRKKKAN